MASTTIFDRFWVQLLEEGLREDGLPWDWTARPIEADELRAKLICKGQGVWAGDGLVSALRASSGLSIECLVQNGQKLEPGQVVMKWVGDAQTLLAYERSFINLASYVCGIATQTALLVDAVRKSGVSPFPRVTATRKTLPFYKDLAIYGVIAGGGWSHRLNLASGVLIKENHLKGFGSIKNAIEKTRASAPHLCKIEIEVKNAAELKEALEYGADVVMLDNFSPDQIKAVQTLINEAKAKRQVSIEASGGINVNNIASFAQAGVDVISSGSITHSVVALDLSLLVL